VFCFHFLSLYFSTNCVHASCWCGVGTAGRSTFSCRYDGKNLDDLQIDESSVFLSSAGLRLGNYMGLHDVAWKPDKALKETVHAKARESNNSRSKCRIDGIKSLNPETSDIHCIGVPCDRPLFRPGGMSRIRTVNQSGAGTTRCRGEH
jgi:hypothetical protein